MEWMPIDQRPLATGRYVVAHRGHAEIMYFFSPCDRWATGTKLGWQGNPEQWRATHCALLNLPEGPGDQISRSENAVQPADPQR